MVLERRAHRIDAGAECVRIPWACRPRQCIRAFQRGKGLGIFSGVFRSLAECIGEQDAVLGAGGCAAFVALQRSQFGGIDTHRFHVHQRIPSARDVLLARDQLAIFRRRFLRASETMQATRTQQARLTRLWRQCQRVLGGDQCILRMAMSIKLQTELQPGLRIIGVRGRRAQSRQCRSVIAEGGLCRRQQAHHHGIVGPDGERASKARLGLAWLIAS